MFVRKILLFCCFVLQIILSLGQYNLLAPRASMLVFWPNGTIPFYINPLHYDHEQSLAIMNALTNFAFKSCLKFYPVLVMPEDGQHVLVFDNPIGSRKCTIITEGHAKDKPHRVGAGYDCLTPPKINLIIMKALGFSLEHNRPARDVYIDVQIENVEIGAVELFTKDIQIPVEFGSLPYDINSVMHFDERDYSKNGHKTIIIKDHNVKQIRGDLTPTDQRKIEMVYGPECQKRDRQEKIELCQNYPGVARRKRDVDNNKPETITESLRINRDITPPSLDKTMSKEVTNVLKELGIENKVEEVVDQIYKVTSEALKNARKKYCNGTKPNLRSLELQPSQDNKLDILGLIGVIANYATSMVDSAITNLTSFCEISESISSYQRARCSLNLNCPPSYRSTISNHFRYSTQHKAFIPLSTNYATHYRVNADLESTTSEPNARNKRSVAINSNEDLFQNESTTVLTTEGNTVTLITQSRTDSITKPTTPVTPSKNSTKHVVINLKDKSTTTVASPTNKSSTTTLQTKDKIKTSTGVLTSKNVYTTNKTKLRNKHSKTLTSTGIKNIEQTKGPTPEHKPELRNFMKFKKVNQILKKDLSEHRAWTKYKTVPRFFMNRYNSYKRFERKSIAELENESDLSYEQYDAGKKQDRKNILKERRPYKGNVLEEKPSNIDKIVTVDENGLDRITTLKIRSKRQIEQNQTKAVDKDGKASLRVAKDKDPEPNRSERKLAADNKIELKGSPEIVRNVTNQGLRIETTAVLQHHKDKDEPKRRIITRRNSDFNEESDAGETAEDVGTPQEEDENNKTESEDENKKTESENSRQDEDHDQEDNVKEEQEQEEERPAPKTPSKQWMYVPRTIPLSKINTEFYNDRRWPDGVVRYIIADDPRYDIDDIRKRLEEVNNILKKKTCVRIQEIREEDAKRYQDYLVIDTSPDYVTGRVGGRQNFGAVELFRGGQHRQHAAMMVMAMLGFYFEVARHDRDNFIRVHVRHVRPDKLHHFEKIKEDATLSLPYDYQSATHPAWQFWRKIGKTGISTVATYKTQDPQGDTMRSLGQNQKLLSDGDVLKINSVYGVNCFRSNKRAIEQQNNTTIN